MGKYVFIETRDPFECRDVEQTWALATELGAAGHDVAMFLVQNAVLAARKGAKVETLDESAPVRVLADDLSLRERGIGNDHLKAGIEMASIDVLTDLVMEDDRKPIWT